MFLFTIFSWNFLLILITILVALYFYLSRNFNYFKSIGIDGPKPIPGLGTMYQFFQRDFFTNSLHNVGKYGKIHGSFMVDRPAFVVAEPQLIKDMSIKDFHLFVDRTDLLTGDSMNDRSLFNLFGNEWKRMRSIISPTFSSGKMRKMHPIIVDCVKRLETNLESNMKNNKEVNIKKFMTNFSLDVIACCAFGTKIDTYSDEKNEFIKNFEKIYQGVWRMLFFFILAFISPKLLQLVKFKLMNPSITNFFKSAIRSIISRREKEGGKHYDYIQLMINARNKVQDIDEEDEDDNSEQLFRQSDDKQTIENMKVSEGITEMDILATSFLFFIAGHETTAATLSHMLYSLAMNEKCQQKLYEEVEKFGPEFNYEDIARMQYLEACVAETLRLYNPVSTVSRLASQDYKLGDTGITIPKGMLVNFDMNSVHHNHDYYEDPFKFNPERFMPENNDKLTPYTYMPFGMGPRNCVGMRFALMETKTAAAYLIYKYRFFKTANTQNELKPKKYLFIYTAGDIPIGIEMRNKLNK